MSRARKFLKLTDNSKFLTLADFSANCWIKMNSLCTYLFASKNDTEHFKLKSIVLYRYKYASIGVSVQDHRFCAAPSFGYANHEVIWHLHGRGRTQRQVPR